LRDVYRMADVRRPVYAVLQLTIVMSQCHRFEFDKKSM